MLSLVMSQLVNSSMIGLVEFYHGLFASLLHCRGCGEAIYMQFGIGGDVHPMHCLRLVPAICSHLRLEFDESKWNEMREEFLQCKSTMSCQPCGVQSYVQTAMGSLKSDTSGGGRDSGSFSSAARGPGFGRSQSVGTLSETGATDTVWSDDTNDSVINQLQAQISDLKRKVKNKDKQCLRLKRSLTALQDFVGIKNMKGLAKKKTVKQQQEMKSLRMLNISKRGVAERNLTPSGVVAVGLRMALSCCSALGFPSASWTDISRQTVSRCEVNVAACCALRGAMIGHFMMHMMKTSQDKLFGPPCMMPSIARKLLVLDHIQLPDDNGDDHTAFRARVACVLSMFNIPASVCEMFSCNMVDVSTPCVVGLSLQNDATNSNIWQKRKLTTAVVHAGMLTDRNALETSNYRSAFFVDAFMFLVVWISSSAIIYIMSFFVLILYHCTMTWSCCYRKCLSH